MRDFSDEHSDIVELGVLPVIGRMGGWYAVECSRIWRFDCAWMIFRIHAI